jgi:hypothetical protein
MATVTETTAAHKSPIAYYGWLHDTYGIFLQADGQVSFRDDETQCWKPVDLPTLTTWAVLNGRADLADTQRLVDGDRVRRCSQTLASVVRSRN